MEIEYSGRYKRLENWANLKEHLFQMTDDEKDVEILKGVRTFCVEAASKCYEQIGRLDAAAKQAALFVNNEVEAGRVSGDILQQPRVDVNPAPRNLYAPGRDVSRIPKQGQAGF